jgi:hypothetical protein
MEPVLMSIFGLVLGDRSLLALARQEGVYWFLKAFLVSGKLPEEESEAERITR